MASEIEKSVPATPLVVLAPEQLARAIEAFRKVGRKYDVLGRTKDEVVARYGL